MLSGYSENQIEKETAKLYGKIFQTVPKEEYELQQIIVSPEALMESSESFSGKRVLELGCGGLGHSIAGFLKNGVKEIVGIDISAENIRVLSEKFKNNQNVHLICGDICDVRINLGCFDIVYSNGVIHHTKNPEKIVKYAYDNLMTGGFFVIGLYGKGGIIPLTIEAIRKMKHLIPTEILFRALNKYFQYSSFYIMDYIYVPILRRYTQKEAEDLLTRSGFVKISRLKNTPTRKFDLLSYFQQAQCNYKRMITKILHGEGYILLKGKKN